MASGADCVNNVDTSDPATILRMVVIFLVVAAFCVAHIVKPDWFIKRCGVRKGGEMLTEWNRLGFQIVGAAVTGFVLYVLYTVLAGYLAH